MRTRMLLGVAAGLALVLGAALAADAPPAKPKNVVDKPIVKGKKAEAVEAAALARSLAAYGEKKKSPAMLVAAAEILIDNPVGRLEARKTTLGPTSLPAGTESRPAATPALDVPRLLTEGLQLAAKDKTVQSFIKQVQDRAPDATRGPVGGPLARDGTLGAGCCDLWWVEFKANEPPVVAVAGDPGADLTLSVYDQSNNLIVGGERGVGLPLAWVLDHQATFLIKVVNKAASSTNCTVICQ